MTSYICLIHKEPDSGYGLHFPDFPGIIDVADTLEDARIAAPALLELCLETWAEDGLSIPVPSPLDDIMGDPDNRDGVAYLVAAKSRRAKAVRINMTMDEDLLADVDAAAKRHGTTRSGFLADAARAKLAS